MVDLVVRTVCVLSIDLSLCVFVYWIVCACSLWSQLAIRRDEANHRDVNHTFASLAADDTNPFVLKHVKESGTPLKKADTTEAPIAH